MHKYPPVKQSTHQIRWIRPLLFSALVIFATVALACNSASEQPTAGNNDPDQNERLKRRTNSTDATVATGCAGSGVTV